MLKLLIRRTAVTFAGAAVIQKSVEENKQNENSIWENLKPDFLKFKNVSIMDHRDDYDKSNLSGWDKLYIMFTKDEFGYISKELNSILYITYSSFFAGSFVGIIRNTKKAHNDFIRNNQATQFANMFEAKKALQDKVVLAAFKGMFQLGSKVAFFSFSVMTLTFSLMTYYGNVSVLHFGASGAVFGGLYKWKTGPKGMLVAGAVGGLLGLISGSMSYGLLNLFGANINDVINYQDESFMNRQKIMKKFEENSFKSIDPKIADMIKERNMLVNDDEGEVTVENKKVHGDNK